MIGIIDYGLGNLFSLGNALQFIGCPYRFIKKPEEAEGLSSLILPGVGAFPEGMKNLNASGMTAMIKEWKKPLLGICLGMQLLFDESEEFTLTKGLSLIPGKVTKIKTNYKIPHMGWNSLTFDKDCPLFDGINEDPYVYFVHSFMAETEPKYLIASADYGARITAAAARGNVYGTQFHPEKSGDAGLTILKNFMRLSEAGL